MPPTPASARSHAADSASSPAGTARTFRSVEIHSRSPDQAFGFWPARTLLGSAQQLLAFGVTARPKSGQHTFPVLVALREHRPLMLYRRHTYRLRLLLSLAVAVDLTRLGFRHAAVSCARMSYLPLFQLHGDGLNVFSLFCT